MNNRSVFNISISAAGCVGAGCALMKRDRRAGGSRTPLDLACRSKKPRRLAHNIKLRGTVFFHKAEACSFLSLPSILWDQCQISLCIMILLFTNLCILYVYKGSTKRVRRLEDNLIFLLTKSETTYRSIFLCTLKINWTKTWLIHLHWFRSHSS